MDLHRRLTIRHMSRAHEEIIDFMARRAPEVVAEFRPSKETRQRAICLLGHLKDGTLSPDEYEELDSYVKLETIMAQAKARALS
jgi:hypothetical protein